jgi:tRNA(adenine34) deaminase
MDIDSNFNLELIHLAFAQAEKAFSQGEVPIGAVIYHRKQQKILAKSHNMVITLNDPTAHAEIMAIRDACKITGNYRLHDCDIYVTLEPCAMCAQAISNARIDNLYFSAEDKKGGGVENGARIFSHNTCHHKPEIYGGILEQQSMDILRKFFASKR